ncbi:MAG TPA: hypothetical protein VEV45_11230 [Streptosporangiaceae bacterium]|nr:hypothetical protein [Streptosporangiaceae bacterium]
MPGRRNAAFELRQWAEQEGVEIFALKPCGRPPDSVADQFPRTLGLGADAFTGGTPAVAWRPGRYFEITIIDADHVRRSGFARVRTEVHDVHYDLDRMIDFVWLTSKQLNWRDRPPRRSAAPPPDRAEGWYTDHTGAHELRWYSVGTPTDLVKDGSIESRDPPPPIGVS